MTESREKVKKVLDFLFGQITQGLIYFYCARSLHGAFQKSRLMESSYFFFGVYRASVREAVLAVSRIMIKHRDSITIHYFLNLVENNLRLFSKDDPESVRRSVTSDRERLERYGQLVENAREQRDRVLAHLDRKHVNSPSDLFAHREGVNLTELGECLSEVLGILNSYAGYYGTEFDPSRLEQAVAGDVDILLEWMNEYGKVNDWVRSPVS